MTLSHDHNPIELDLQSLVDGELDGPALARVQRHLAEHPEAGRQVTNALLLKRQIGLAMRSGLPAASPALRNAVTQLMAQADMNQPGPASPVENNSVENEPQPLKLTPPPPASLLRHAFWTRWMPPAIAAIVILGVSIAAWQHTASRPAQTVAAGESTFGSLAGRDGGKANVVTASLDAPEAPVAYAQLSQPRVEAMGRRHNTCSKKLDALYRAADFPQKLSEMPTAIAGCVGKKPKCSLDLSRMGYEFTRAGQCDSPGERAVHMVYRAKTRNGDSLSVWVVPYHGKPEIREGVVYQGNVADSDTPVFFWRQDDLVYYVVANSFDRARTAAQNLVASK